MLQPLCLIMWFKVSADSHPQIWLMDFGGCWCHLLLEEGQLHVRRSAADGPGTLFQVAELRLQTVHSAGCHVHLKAQRSSSPSEPANSSMFRIGEGKKAHLTFSSSLEKCWSSSLGSVWSGSEVLEVPGSPPSTPCSSSSVAFSNFRTSVVTLRRDAAEYLCPARNRENSSK